MDAREREAPQTLRPGTKRPWEPDTSLRDDHWHGARLPPIEPTPYNHSSASVLPLPNSAADGGLHSYGRLETSRIASKKARLEGKEYSTSSSWRAQQLDHPAILSNKIGFNPTFAKREPSISYDPPQDHRNVPPPHVSPDISYLCRRCKRAVRDKEEEHGVSAPCDACGRNPELAYVTQAAATGLTQLATTLKTGKPSEQRNLNPSPGKQISDCPPIEQTGLKSSLTWLLSKINELNRLADSLVQQAPSGAVEIRPGPSPSKSSPSRDGPNEKASQRFGDFQDLYTRPGDRDSADPGGRSLIASLVGNEENPPVASQSSYPPGLLPAMNRPAARNRQLPSPPGRQMPSPNSLSHSSPGGASYSSSQSLGHPVHHPLGSSQGGLATNAANHSAFQAHTAGLQHEISVQKIALSSLQGEHDKLLAAFSRSQTRATALERKHAVSDGEIITLTEEKLRLQQQVTELEKDVEDTTKSRDGYRQAAVQESMQYIEIVKKATRLEALAGEEKKRWDRLKAEMEERIEFFSSPAKAARNNCRSNGGDWPSDSTELNAGEVNPKTTQTVEAGSTASEAVACLKEEIRRLRSRCREVEDALRAVRADTERIIGSLSTSGRTITNRVDSVLEPGDTS